MIEKMHEKSNGLVFKIIFALVSISFVLGGIGTGLMSNDTSAIKINGEEISQQVFNAQKSRQQNVLNAELGERFWDLLDNPEYAKQFQDSVLNQLINDELLRQYAKNLNLGISADQIKSEIVNSSFFQKDGKFDNTLYQQTLRNRGLTPDGYASIVYEGMLFSQIQEGIVSTDFVVPAQQALLAKLLLQNRQVRLANYPISEEFVNQTTTEAELQNYYNEHKSEFINPEKLIVDYVVVTPQELGKNIQVTDEQINTYYQTNKAKYVTQGEARIAHIQVASQADANAIEQELKNGADFATVAKEKSLDKISANQGGDLGWAKAGVFPKAFEDAANSLAIGEISKPINVDGAYHIVKVLERNAGQTIPVEQLKAQITETIRNELVLAEYSRITREMANRAFEDSGSLESVAQAAGVSVQKTEQFTRNDVPSVLNHEKVLRVLFNSDIAKNGQNSEAIEIGDSTHPSSIFVRVSNYQAQSNQTFDEAKTAVEQIVKYAKAEKALAAKAEEKVKALKNGDSAEVTFGQPEELMFAQAQLQQPQLAQTIFAMPKPIENQATYQVAEDGNGNIVIIELIKVTDGDLEGFKPFAAQFVQADRVVLLNNLLKDLRERAKIEVNQDFINQPDNLK